MKRHIKCPGKSETFCGEVVDVDDLAFNGWGIYKVMPVDSICEKCLNLALERSYD